MDLDALLINLRKWMAAQEASMHAMHTRISRIEGGVQPAGLSHQQSNEIAEIHTKLAEIQAILATPASNG